MSISHWCERVIRYCFFLLFALVPLILTPWNYELFEFNKMFTTYALTGVILGAWIVRMGQEKRFSVAKTPFDIPIFLFIASQLISTVLSMDPHVSWRGYYSRFNGGMWSLLAYTTLYYAFVTHIRDAKDKTQYIKQLLGVMTTTATLVAGYGILQRLGIDKEIWVQDVQNRIFSTLGQPNWLAAYLIAIFPIILWFLYTSLTQKIEGTKKRAQSVSIGTIEIKAISVFFGIQVVMIFAAILFTRSRSGFLGLFLSQLIFWPTVLLITRNLKRTLVQLAVVAVLCFPLLFFHGTKIYELDKWVTYQGWKDRFTTSAPSPVPQANATQSAETLLTTGGTESGTIRKYVWKAAIDAWKSSTKTYLFGTGTETFAFAFYAFRPNEHNLTSEWDFLYNKAHNEYLNYLTTTGIFGFGTYIFFIACVLWWGFRHVYWPIITSLVATYILKKKSAHSHTPDMLTVALLAGWTSLLITDFFGFSVVIIQLFFFLIPAFLPLVMTTETPGKSYARTLANTQMTQKIGWILGGGLGSSIVLVVFLFWIADSSFAKGYQNNRLGKYETAAQMIEQAVAINPKEPLYADELSVIYASLAGVAAEEKNATKAAELAQKSLRASDRAIKTSPNNVNFWKSRTKIYYAFSAFDEQFQKAAIDALEHSLSLSPRDPKIMYNLAVLYGQSADTDKAIQMLRDTIGAKPNYRDAYYALYIFYIEAKQPEKAIGTLQAYLTNVNPQDKEFLEMVQNPQ